MNKGLKIFITYAHKNSEAKDELITSLAVLKQNGLIDVWHDNEILPGDKWRDEIFNNLADSDILLYLTCRYSLASENCNKEFDEAADKNKIIIPIILESCDWQSHQLSDFQALPDKGKPINEWQPESNGWQNVVDGIRKQVIKIQSQIDTSSEISEEEPNIESGFQWGHTLMMLGRSDSAIETYSSVIELNPRYAEAYNSRGDAYHNRREYNRAIEDYNKAIELKPDYHASYNNRGNAYSDIKQFDQAIKDYNTAIKLDPDHPYPYNGRGNAYSDIKQFDQAIKDYNTAIKLDPGYATPYNSRGEFYREKKEFDLAIKDYNKAIELKPDYHGAYSNRGIAYRRKKDFDRAIKNFDKAIELKPDFALSYNNRGNVYKDKKEFDLAIKDYNKAIELKPDYTYPYNNRGDVYRIKHMLDLAFENYNKAIELDPNYANAYYNRGVAWLHIKEWEEARKDLNTAQIKGRDIIEAFQNDYGSVEDFEQETGIQLPENIAALLTPPQA